MLYKSLRLPPCLFVNTQSFNPTLDYFELKLVKRPEGVVNYVPHTLKIENRKSHSLF